MCWLDNYQNSPYALVSCSFGEHHDAKQPAESSWRKRRYECFCSLKRYTFTSVSYEYLLRRKFSYFVGVLNADMSRKTTKKSDSDGDDSDGLPPLLPCTSDEEVEKS